jgi:hypothetical protein
MLTSSLHFYGLLVSFNEACTFFCFLSSALLPLFPRHVIATFYSFDHAFAAFLPPCGPCFPLLACPTSLPSVPTPLLTAPASLRTASTPLQPCIRPLQPVPTAATLQPEPNSLQPVPTPMLSTPPPPLPHMLTPLQ